MLSYHFTKAATGDKPRQFDSHLFESVTIAKVINVVIGGLAGRTKCWLMWLFDYRWWTAANCPIRVSDFNFQDLT